MKSSENGAGGGGSPAYTFGDFVLDEYDLRRGDGTPVPLTPRLFDTLRFLVRHHDRLLPKEEIMDAVWPDAVVEENNLSQAVSKLRQALGENPDAPEFIVTVPRRGYRFVAPVRITTSEPARRGAEAPEPPLSPAPPWRRNLIRVMAVLLLAAVVALAWWQYSRSIKSVSSEATSAFTQKSIAVLPFANLSSDKTDAFFAEGIQDDILTSLGKIKNLKVIARASTADYRATPSAAKLREIGRALGATHVLEGSVRRVDDRVVINVVLVDINDNRQVWSERYDRTLTDTLSVQGELAITIARELHATLSPLENAVAATKPTENAEAYLFYLRGREAEFGFQKSASISDALPLYQRAVDLDPAFALARARLAICAAGLLREQGDPQMRLKARSEAEAAVRAQPQLGEAHLAMALHHLWGEDDYARAQAELDRAGELLPNSAEVPLVAAFIHKMHRRYPERVAALQRAESLDPRNRMVIFLTHLTHRWMRNPLESMRTLDRLVVIRGDADHSIAWSRALDEFHLTNDIASLERVLADEAANPASPPGKWPPFARYFTAMLKRDFAAAAEALAAISPAYFDDLDFAGPKSFHEAFLAAARGADAGETERAFTTARNECQARLASLAPPGADETLYSLRNTKARRLSQVRVTLALIDAFLGRKDEAFTAATEAINDSGCLPGSVEYHHFRSVLALVHARSGEPDKALDLIESLLRLPTELPEAAIYNITVAHLKWSWVWDPLRSNPRFQKFLAP